MLLRVTEYTRGLAGKNPAINRGADEIARNIRANIHSLIQSPDQMEE